MLPASILLNVLKAVIDWNNWNNFSVRLSLDTSEAPNLEQLKPPIRKERRP